MFVQEKDNDPGSNHTAIMGIIKEKKLRWKNTSNIGGSVSFSFAFKCYFLREPQHPFTWGAMWRCQHSHMSYVLWKENHHVTAWGSGGLLEAGPRKPVALLLSPAWILRREEILKGHLACAVGFRDWLGLWKGTRNSWYEGTPGQIYLSVSVLSRRSHLPRKGLL